MSSSPERLLSGKEYLAMKREAEFKSEFLNGETFAMAGVAGRHSRIVLDLVGSFDN